MSLSIEIDGNIYNIRTQLNNDEIVYCILDVAKILDIKKNSNNIKKYYLKTSTNGGIQRIVYTNFEGLKILISRSRSLFKIKLAEYFNIEILNLTSIPIECSTLNIIMEIFKGENMQRQYIVEKYRIDLYFLDYKLALECDEKNHNSERKKKEDIIRQKYIENKLKCIFIRYEPDKKDFDITIIINEIFKHIKYCMITNTMQKINI